MVEQFNFREINSVLFICMGNLCRSPSAEAVFRHKVAEKGIDIVIDSAGTSGSHVRDKPDHRAVKAGEARGYSFDKLRARKVTAQDFSKFDIVIAMDNDNIRELKKVAPEELQDKIVLFLDFAKGFDDKEVPDPYYGGARGFQLVLDMVEDASNGLIEKLQG